MSVPRNSEALAVRIGAGTKFANIGGQMLSDAAQVSINNNTETTVATYTLVANSFKNNGDVIVARFVGKEENISTLNTLKVYFDGTVLYTVNTTATGVWDFELTLILQDNSTPSASVVRWVLRIFDDFGGTQFFDVASGTVTSDITGTLIVKLTHTASTSGATPYATKYWNNLQLMPTNAG